MPNDSEEAKKILADRGPCLIETMAEGVFNEHERPVVYPPVVYKCYFDDVIRCEWLNLGPCLKSFIRGTEMYALREKSAAERLK